MMLERYRVRDQDGISGVWLRAFNRVYERGELFHLLFHPERFSFICGPASFVVNESMKLDPPVWHATLGEIKDWWEARRASSWRVERTARPGERYVMSLVAPRGATVLIKSPGDRGGRFFYRNYKVLPGADKGGELVFETESPESHMISVDGSNEPVREFLRDEGFIIREGAPDVASFSTGRIDPLSGAEKLKLLERIDASPYPLIRIWRWPAGARCAFSVSSDVDSINVADFLRRLAYF